MTTTLPKFTFLIAFVGDEPPRTETWSGTGVKDAKEICFANLGALQERVKSITPITSSEASS